MVFFQQHCIEQSQAVIGAASSPHCRLLQGAEARRGLAGIDDACTVRRRRLDRPGSLGRNPGEVLEEVQRDALARDTAASPEISAATSPGLTVVPSDTDWNCMETIE